MTTLARVGSRLMLVVVLAEVLVTRAGAGTVCNDATTLIVVRHADRAGSADSLSAAGVARARVLAQAAAKSGVTAIYHSDTERARLTVEPLAKALGVKPVVLPAQDVAGLVRDIFEKHCGGTVLIVGHSNTVPLIISAAGGPLLPDIAEDDFDDLFVLSVVGRTANLTKLQYGAATP